MMENRDSLHQQLNMKSDQGQSTIEFLMTFAFVFAMLFLFIKIALNFTNGYLVQYANFMASRAYLVHDTNQAETTAYNSAFQRARQVFDLYKISSFMNDFSGTLKVNNPGAVLPFYVGTFVEYDEKFSLSKVMGGAFPMSFRAESFLGKEPVRRDCAKRVCKALTMSAGNCTEYTTFFDNGC